MVPPGYVGGMPRSHAQQNLKKPFPCIYSFILFNILERVTGIEPVSSAWKADIKAIIRYPPALLFCKSFGGQARHIDDFILILNYLAI